MPWEYGSICSFPKGANLEVKATHDFMKDSSGNFVATDHFGSGAKFWVGSLGQKPWRWGLGLGVLGWGSWGGGPGADVLGQESWAENRFRGSNFCGVTKSSADSLC